MKIPLEIPPKNIRPLLINGLHGRTIHIEGDQRKVIVYIHGLHTLAERHYSLCDYLSDFGEVYGPDMPGFGGMDSFYKVGLEPTYDNYADYIYTFIKSLSVKSDQKLCLVGLSFGSQVMIRLLQKYPDIVEMNPQVISLAGIGSFEDIRTLRAFKAFVIPFSMLCSTKYGSKVINLLLFNPLVLRFVVLLLVMFGAKNRSNKEDWRKVFQMEYNLWKLGDTRTHGFTTVRVFKTSLIDSGGSVINLPLHNVAVSGDQYIDANKLAKTMTKIFASYDVVDLPLDSHAPNLIADKKEVAELFPDATRKLLSV
jgi:pimeloyl-ACP methyl ester carboxylesterase